MKLIKHAGIEFEILKIANYNIFFKASDTANAGATRKKEIYRRQLMRNKQGKPWFRFRNYHVYLENIIEIDEGK